MSTCKVGKAGQAVSIEEARQALGLSRSMIYRMADDGRLPTVRIGKRILVPVLELEALLRGGPGEHLGGGEDEH